MSLLLLIPAGYLDVHLRLLSAAQQTLAAAVGTVGHYSPDAAARLVGMIVDAVRYSMMVLQFCAYSQHQVTAPRPIDLGTVMAQRGLMQQLCQLLLDVADAFDSPTSSPLGAASTSLKEQVWNVLQQCAAPVERFGWCFIDDHLSSSWRMELEEVLYALHGHAMPARVPNSLQAAALSAVCHPAYHDVLRRHLMTCLESVEPQQRPGMQPPWAGCAASGAAVHSFGPMRPAVSPVSAARALVGVCDLLANALEGASATKQRIASPPDAGEVACPA